MTPALQEFTFCWGDKITAFEGQDSIVQGNEPKLKSQLIYQPGDAAYINFSVPESIYL